MNADIQGKIDSIKAPFQGVMDAADAIPALVDAAEQAKYDAGKSDGDAVGYARGFQDGKDSIQLPSPTLPDGSSDPALIYTQAQMDAAVTAGKAQQSAEDQVAFNEQVAKVADLSKQVADLQAQLAGQVPADDLKKQIVDLQTERDGLRAAIQVEIDDAKTDTDRLEKALAPIVEVPVDPVPADPAPVGFRKRK
jgi:hypothetical protein